MSLNKSGAQSGSSASTEDMLLFWGCFTALIATAFGFMVRTQIIGEWATLFDFNETQKGQILGVGLWPFAISIVIFSLVIDRIGYGKAMVFAFVCHVSSALITIFAKELSGGDNKTGYWILYVGTFICAIGNGTVEAVINPVVATLFAKEKTKWLNILHAGWPGGAALSGVLAMSMGDTDWRLKVALIFLPVIAYGFMLMGRKFPVNERVSLGGSYETMLKQVGVIGAMIVVGLIVSEVGTFFGWPLALKLSIGLVLVGMYGAKVKSLGSPLFIVLLLIMLPLAITELGTDSWITELMKPAMSEIGVNSGWILIWTMTIMLILRFCAGPIVHSLSPLGLLATSAALAAVGLVFLSQATGVLILAAATLYGVGKTFFWPTMLGVVAEQYPQGGALTLNTIAGVGMLSVGVLGNPFFGYLQDTRVARTLEANDPTLFAKVVSTEDKTSVFGSYRSLDNAAIEQLSESDRETITTIKNAEIKNALTTVAILPCIMLVSFIGLILYFRSQGGYKSRIAITEHEEDMLMSGGSAGPSEM